jgi:hypothetical protein
MVHNLSEAELLAVTSIITLIELLSLKIPEKEVDKLKLLYLETPNLKTISID